MGVIFTVSNQKGGVGKTTTAVTLAHGLAREGFSVLLVDLDSQGNVADSLGLDAGNDLYRLLFPGLARPLGEVVTPSGRENLDVIRSDKHTAALKIALAAVDFREYVLYQVLVDAPYDVIILDCAPSIDLLHTAALVAADYLIVPTRLDQLAVKGVRDVLQTLQAVRRAGRTQCELLAILPTFYDRVTSESHAQFEHLVNVFGSRVWPPIPVDTHCRVAPRYGKTLWEYAPRTRALVGVQVGNGRRVGGYVQALERLVKLLQ